MINLFSSVFPNALYLRQDFVGFSLLPHTVLNFLIDVILSVSIILVYFLIGKKILNTFFRKEIGELFLFEDFISIALGYISVGTTFSILGTFSLFSKDNILIVLLFFILLAIFPINKTQEALRNLFKNFKDIFIKLKQHKLIFFLTALFVIAAFLKLLSPEIREDQYHTDFPTVYLQQHTMMIPIGQPLRAIPSPQLTEMSYLITIYIGDKEASRFISFIFYLLVISVFYNLSKFSKDKLPIYSILLFVSTPIIIKLAATEYVELQFILCFLLSIIVLTLGKIQSQRRIILSAILFGGMLATKLWTITFLPIPIAYLIISNKSNPIKIIKESLVFIFFSLSVTLIWYIRAYILSGDPFYPAFTKESNLENTYNDSSVTKFFGLNYRALDIANLKEFSPLFFWGIFFVVLTIKEFIKTLKSSKILWFVIIFLIEYCFIQYYLGRYLLGIYPFLILISSLGIYYSVTKFKLLKYLFILIALAVSGYYLISSLITLPYGIGLANENAYLTRVLAKDNTSYYDFNHLFDKFINKNEIVGIHDLSAFYYANFYYLDDNYIFTGGKKDFSQLKNKKITKFIIKGGDMNWLCKKYLIANCDSKKYKLLSVFEERHIYLYKIN